MEYGLLVALIAVVIAVAVAALGTVLRDTVQNACDKVNGTTAATRGDDCKTS